MVDTLTSHQSFQLGAISDKGFQKAFRHPEFSWIGPNGQRQVRIEWLFPWAWSDLFGSVKS
jgi:hypothetical protein